MNNTLKVGLLVTVTVIFFGLATGVRAASLIPDKVHSLPVAPIATQPVSEEYVHIKSYVAHDPLGHTISAPAYIVDIYTGALGWESPKPSEVPSFSIPIPKTLRGQFALYYSKEFGWVVVPRDWVLVSAGVGADGGGSLAFVERNTPSESKSGKRGWMAMGVSLGNLIGFGEADGIIPGAHQAMLEGWPGFQKGPSPTLVPKPETIHYLNSCTAVFSYRIPNSPIVRAVVYFGPSMEPAWQDKSMSEIYLALPNSKSPLANLIFKTFYSQLGPCTAATK